MEDYELDYDVQDVRLWDHVFKVTTVANEALPLEMLLNLQTRREEISGQRLWEGSLLLCAYLVETCCNNDDSSDNCARKSKLDLKDKSVLELGAGTGVVSMLAHRMGASPLVMTDGDERCVMMAQKNIEENEIPADQAFVTVLRWGDDESTNTFCNGFSEWETRRVAGKSSSEINRVALAAGAEGDVAVEAVAGGTALPGGSTTRNELLEDDQTPAVVVRETPKEGNAGALPPCPPPSSSSPSSPLKSFDFVLAGDVLYKHCLLEPFLGTVRDMLAPGGRLLLCHVPRAGVTHDIVERAFVEAGFAFDILTLTGDKEKEKRNKSCNEEDGGPGADVTSVDGAGGGGCDTTIVGGVELCVEYARRARLYEFHSVR